jgi:hypothetical protein
MLEQKMKEYTKRFNDGFPTIPLAWSRSDAELIKIIDECLAKGKDVYELGYVEDEIIY